MEDILKTKIDGLLQKIESGRKREEALKAKILENTNQTEIEEKTVIELHSKLQTLEETLRTKEEDNERLKLQLRDRQVQAECVDEFKERTEVEEINESFKAKQLREEYGDMLIVNNTMKNKANEIVTEITKAEKALRVEEARCESEEERVAGLQKEKENITKRLEEMLKTQEDIKCTENKQLNKIRELREKHAESEKRALLLEEEARKMESKLDSMTHRLVSMKEEQDSLVSDLLKEQENVDASIIEESSKQNNDIHTAMKVGERKM